MKVGGSLFHMPQLRRRLISWLENLPSPCVFVAGGGHFVDEAMREAHVDLVGDQIANSHWKAIHAMSASANWLADLMSPCPVVADFQELIELGPHVRYCIWDVEKTLKEDGGRSLPVSDEATSDSIAAWLATYIGVKELTLLKSVGGETETIELAIAEKRGWVDRCFASLAATLEVEWVNFRTGVACKLLQAIRPDDRLLQ